MISGLTFIKFGNFVIIDPKKKQHKMGLDMSNVYSAKYPTFFQVIFY